MIGIIVELIISWLLLWFISKKDLSVLGFKPTKGRVTNLGVGLLLAASCCTLYQIMTTAFINNSWVLNKQVTGKIILENTRWTLVSVLYEELIFRGALLYIAIEKLSVKKACILSAVGFGIYHWFTFNVLGNPFMMAITFLMTAIAGLSWAFAFAKTNSLYLPIGLHFGWNFINTVVFSNGQRGQAILVRTNENQLQGILSLIVFLFQIFALALLTFWYLNWFSKNKKTSS
ncbi:MAG: CPBP family intramembrane metalloprotease [Sphingobacteriales bacterium]|nr:CPBP family intramembrane metalloprotease [Sphingobacteriales bacterium]MBI3719783.1 CPBP family intramembrane metalloprotease [Sphingobacteriales bacterium]